MMTIQFLAAMLVILLPTVFYFWLIRNYGARDLRVTPRDHNLERPHPKYRAYYAYYGKDPEFSHIHQQQEEEDR